MVLDQDIAAVAANCRHSLITTLDAIGGDGVQFVPFYLCPKGLRIRPRGLEVSKSGPLGVCRIMLGELCGAYCHWEGPEAI